MFENAQQEPSGHDTKIVAGVIVVIMAVLGGLYFAFVHNAPVPTTQPKAAAAASSGGGAPAADANFKADLVVDRPNLGRDKTQTMSVWSLQIVNRSRTYGYRNLKYATTYYDGAQNVIHQGSGSIPDEISPADQRTISNINDGLYPLNTQRYTIEISSADGFTP